MTFPTEAAMITRRKSLGISAILSPSYAPLCAGLQFISKITIGVQVTLYDFRRGARPCRRGKLRARCGKMAGGGGIRLYSYQPGAVRGETGFCRRTEVVRDTFGLRIAPA